MKELFIKLEALDKAEWGLHEFDNDTQLIQFVRLVFNQLRPHVDVLCQLSSLRIHVLYHET
jgi:hypothetical protein